MGQHRASPAVSVQQWVPDGHAPLTQQTEPAGAHTPRVPNALMLSGQHVGNWGSEQQPPGSEALGQHVAPAGQHPASQHWRLGPQHNPVVPSELMASGQHVGNCGSEQQPCGREALGQHVALGEQQCRSQHVAPARQQIPAPPWLLRDSGQHWENSASGQPLTSVAHACTADSGRFFRFFFLPLFFFFASADSSLDRPGAAPALRTTSAPVPSRSNPRRDRRSARAWVQRSNWRSSM